MVTVEAEAAHFSAKPHDLLMPFTAPSAMLRLTFMHGDMAMANGTVDQHGSILNPWRIAGWSIPVILLLLPAVAMRFTSEVDWDAPDFIIIGALFGTIGLGIEFLVRQSRNTAYRVGAVIALVTAFLTIWVNLAVGMIGEDNPYNLLFGAVLLVALVGAVIGKFRPGGMAKAMFATAAAQLLVGAGGLSSDPRGAVFSMMFAAPWLVAGILFRTGRRTA
jgi:hypothetical protein